MVFSKFCKIMVNKVFFVRFKGGRSPQCPPPGSATAEVCMDWIFWMRTPAASNRIRSKVFFAVAVVDLNLVFAEKTLLVVCLIYQYAGSNRSRIAFVMLDPERIRIENFRNRIGSGPKKAESTHLHKTPTAQCLTIYITFMIQTFFIVSCLSINIFLTSLASTTTNFTSLKFRIIYQCIVYLL